MSKMDDQIQELKKVAKELAEQVTLLEVEISELRLNRLLEEGEYL